ncbi:MULTISPECIES: alpha/beta hydrolase [Gordonia]|uniref:alpha/beta hydrolase n=1 Tax=Gordonia TaxID=2053 RepID=UPI0009696504|nr:MULTISPECIES: alpha/beta hydrolase family protein [Gordonia]MDH3005847.1 alpha/beta hydrolase family protein [Gordonia alkanivorans]MDH3016140.1 alpha/beta hydrolase family protein [Gordonia alkanivorans]MDH3040980.1 alpha/beta hydrolase family protein [Gordonia alkanivorans]OLT52571.1 esterase [Gordonia sp. CNJ-863]
MRFSWKRRLGVVACAVAMAATGWAPAVLAAPAPDPNRARIDTVIHDSAQQTTLIVYSAAMRRLVPVNVLRPKDPTKPRPTLYLLNGAGGGEDSATWAAKTQYSKFFRDKQVNVVTPIGGAFSYYTDWQRDDPVLGRNKWTTFLTKELPPLVDKEFNTTRKNAIAGISMAGTSVLNLAISAPKLYKSVAAYSGCARTSDPLGQTYIRMVVADRGMGNVDNMWGPINSSGWTKNDPYVNAAKLRGTKVYMTSGTGLPGWYDRLEAPLVAGDPFTLANQVVVGGVIEAAVNECTKQMAQRMRALKVPHKVLFRPDGTHSWGYWERDLKTTWPMIAKDLK